MNNRVPTFVMMVGLPASGKSTYAKELADETRAVICSSDAIRKELCDDENSQDIGIIKNRKEILNNEYLSKLKQLKNEGDHDEADWLLCQLLKELGFSEIVEVYLKLPKWYS